MLRCSSRLANSKILKIEAGDDDDSCTSDAGGESSSESASPGRNPFEHAVILHHLFKICPLDVLATCRLVSKQWHEQSLLIWRNTSPLRFGLENGYLGLQYVGYDEVRHTLPLQNFIQYMAAADPRPYRYIRISDSKIDSSTADREQIEVFWNAVGSNVTTLELNNCTFPDPEEFRRVIFAQCPNLQRLIIDSCEFPPIQNAPFQEVPPMEYNERPCEQNRDLKFLKIVTNYGGFGKFPVSWLELFNHFPFISSLSYTDGYPLEEERFDDLTKAIRIIRKRNGKLLPLKAFNIGSIEITADSSTKQILTTLKELRLPLQRLIIQLEPGVDEDFVKDTVAVHAETLKDINLFEFLPTPSFSIFPYGHQLNNLLNLSIENSSCKNMAFLSYMPNLETLRIVGKDSADLPTVTISNYDEPKRTHLKLERLERLTLECRLNDEEMENLCDWTPNVTWFSARSLNDTQFGFLCKQWRKLEWLGISEHGLTDEGVTGMTMENKKKKPNITNLQHLKMLSIGSGQLTDKSVFHGYLLLPNLKCIRKLGGVRWGYRARRAILDREIKLEEAWRSS